MGLRRGLPVGPFRPFGHSALPTYPLKPPSAGQSGYIPLCEVDPWSCFQIETGKAFPVSDTRSFSVLSVSITVTSWLLIEFLFLDFQIAHETRRVSAFRRSVAIVLGPRSVGVSGRGRAWCLVGVEHGRVLEEDGQETSVVSSWV